MNKNEMIAMELSNRIETGTRQIMVSRGNQIGWYSDWVPGSHPTIAEAIERGMREFDGDFSLWEDIYGEILSVDMVG